MKNLLKIAIALLLTVNVNCFAQKVYYVVNGEDMMSDINYKVYKDNKAKNRKLEEVNLKTIKKKDSIVNYIRLTNLEVMPDGFDPWGDTKKFIGTKFQIEQYADNDQKNFKKDYLEGKPTYINFWFTRCPPCIEELPLLNQLKENFKDKVNFISITFDDLAAVEVFLKKHNFDFKHINHLPPKNKFTIISEKKYKIPIASRTESIKVLNASFFNSGSSNLGFSFL